jgi:hypothetical protein
VLEYHFADIEYGGATLRDTIADAKSWMIPLCELSLHFKNAFDRIANE